MKDQIYAKKGLGLDLNAIGGGGDLTEIGWKGKNAGNFDWYWPETVNSIIIFVGDGGSVFIDDLIFSPKAWGEEWNVDKNVQFMFLTSIYVQENKKINFWFYNTALSSQSFLLVFKGLLFQPFKDTLGNREIAFTWQNKRFYRHNVIAEG